MTQTSKGCELNNVGCASVVQRSIYKGEALRLSPNTSYKTRSYLILNPKW